MYILLIVVSRLHCLPEASRTPLIHSHDELHFTPLDILINHYRKAPLKKGARQLKAHFNLTINICYLHVVLFPNSELKLIMHKPVGLLTAPARLTAHPFSIMTQVI